MTTLKTTTFDSALVIANHEGEIVAINDRCSELFGYTSQELIKQKLDWLMPSPYKEQHQMYISRFVADGIPKVIMRESLFCLLTRSEDDWSRQKCARAP